MTDSTPLARALAPLIGIGSMLDHLVFRALDLRALARGWEVQRTTSFRRVYRDSRWRGISACADCRGTGLGATRRCTWCGGVGTVRRAAAETAVIP